MPSPRLSGSGAKKILILPQILENHVFNVIVLCCYSPKQILGLLFICAIIGSSTCNLEIPLTLFCIVIKGFTHRISVHISGTCVAPGSGVSLSIIEMSPKGIVPSSACLMPGMLWAIANHMSLLTTTITSDFPDIEAIASSLASSVRTRQGLGGST